jgi:hypothetical protein
MKGGMPNWQNVSIDMKVNCHFGNSIYSSLHFSVDGTDAYPEELSRPTLITLCKLKRRLNHSAFNLIHRCANRNSEGLRFFGLRTIKSRQMLSVYEGAGGEYNGALNRILKLSDVAWPPVHAECG